MALRFGTSFEAISRFAQLADYSIAFALRAVNTVGVADALADGPRAIDDLARATSCHAPSLLRVLRALTGEGVFTEPEPGTFALTEISDLLRSDHPLSMRAAFRTQPDVAALADLAHTVRTGQPAFDHVYGEEYWTYLSGKPDLLAEFQDSQAALTRLEMLTVLRTYRWSTLATVVDVGGNDGTFLSELLVRNPSMTGTLVDLRGTVARAPKVFADAGVTERATIAPGNVFENPLPAGAAGYVIKRVLVGLADTEVVTLLRTVRAAMTDESRLLVIEPVQAGTDDISSDMDVLMLALGSGRVRTPDEFSALFGAAGMELVKVRPSRPSSVVEARPV